MKPCRGCDRHRPLLPEKPLLPPTDCNTTDIFTVIYSPKVPPNLGTTHKIDTLLTNCSDFRLVDDAVMFMNKHYKSNYDQLVLPGASAGVVNYPDWRRSYFEQIDLLFSLHHQHEVHLMDHEDCGVYKALYGPQFYKEHMFQLHALNLRKCKELLQERLSDVPKLLVKMLLMMLDGTVLSLA